MERDERRDGKRRCIRQNHNDLRSRTATSFSGLSDDLQFEIFRRLPPSPPFLARATTVCKEWRRIVNDPGFLRALYRARHGAPVTVGFFHNYRSKDEPRAMVTVGDPASFSFDSDDRSTSQWLFLDCRHGRVLLCSSNWHRFLVWHPMTGERHLITTVGQLDHVREDEDDYDVYGAVLLCDCVADDHHVAGETSPYRVAVLFRPSMPLPGCLCVTIFSSLTGEWCSYRWSGHPRGYGRYPCVIIGDTLYQSLTGYNVLAINTDTWNITASFERPRYGNAILHKADGGVLGHAAVQHFTLYMWTRDADADAWVLRTTVDLSGIIPDLATTTEPLPSYSVITQVKISGVDEEGDALFLWCRIGNGIFMLRPKSMELTKVHESEVCMEWTRVYPYAAFYLPHAVRQLNN